VSVWLSAGRDRTGRLNSENGMATIVETNLMFLLGLVRKLGGRRKQRDVLNYSHQMTVKDTLVVSLGRREET